MSNKYLIVRPTENQTINIPIEMNWDFYGRTDSIELYEDEVLKDIIGVAEDFEVLRFSHKDYGTNEQTVINYDFYFYDSSQPVVNSTSASDWVNSYLFPNATPSGFSATQVYYYEKPFTKSFFKLDFYDTPDSQSQTNYFTIIIPVQQGETEPATVSPLLPIVQIRKPSYFLDFVGDKEGFFIYWLKNFDYLKLSTFYMSAKFFDGRFGVFVRMMNEPQSSLPNKFLFDGTRYFYYKVELDYTTKTYQVFDYLNNRIGNGNPINWYEYINP